MMAHRAIISSRLSAPCMHPIKERKQQQGNKSSSWNGWCARGRNANVTAMHMQARRAHGCVMNQMQKQDACTQAKRHACTHVRCNGYTTAYITELGKHGRSTSCDECIVWRAMAWGMRSDNLAWQCMWCWCKSQRDALCNAWLEPEVMICNTCTQVSELRFASDWLSLCLRRVAHMSAQRFAMDMMHDAHALTICQHLFLQTVTHQLFARWQA